VEKTKQNLIHDASLDLLASTGVAFYGEEAVQFFKSHGFKTRQNLIFFSEAQIQTALDSAPLEFIVKARDSKYDLRLGGQNAPALAPGYGAPFIVENNGRRRKATIDDYQSFCKLVQTSKVINFTGFMMGDPSDVPLETYHLDMLLNSILLCSKPFMGSPLTAQAAKDAVQMAKIVFGNSLEPVMVSNINAMAPLQFAPEMAQAIMIFSKAGQPIIITGGGIMGSTVPIQPVDLLIIQNASILAGICLSQLVNPGAPVIYGTAGSPLDMQTGAFYHGCPETNQVIREGLSMANFYGLPSRGGGALTDAHSLDYQAGYQSALSLKAALDSHASFILHACGILSTYMAMNFEKFLADEELCLHILKARKPLEFSHDPIDLSIIKEVGVGGQFLTHPATFKRCRTEFLSLPLANRLPFDTWQAQPDKSYQDKAEKALAMRLDKYQKPDIDSSLENELMGYVKSRKKKI
jgi:trimethylamine--corrinoid protein Co-methyltransferase